MEVVSLILLLSNHSYFVYNHTFLYQLFSIIISVPICKIKLITYACDKFCLITRDLELYCGQLYTFCRLKVLASVFFVFMREGVGHNDLK